MLRLEPQQYGLEQVDSLLRRAPCNSYCSTAIVGGATAAMLQLAVLHADDPAFLTPIAGQQQLPAGMFLDEEFLEQDYYATQGSCGDWGISTELGSFSFWRDGRWS